MPNSATHADRMAKVKQGFTAAKISSADVDRVMGVFDSLVDTLATTVAQRTEFSVSTSSKASETVFGASRGEERRQMARAILFVDDVTRVYDEVPLPTKPTNGQFETLWRGDFTKLAASLTAKTKALCEIDFKFREILNAPVVTAPRPEPKRMVIPDDTRKLLTSTVRNQYLRGQEVLHRHSSLQTTKTAWSDSKTQLVAIFATVVNTSMSNMMAAQTAGTGAYTEFEAFFRAVGKENEAKIAMAKSFFGALSSYAPFPLSIVGKVGGAACGLLHTDVAIRQERVVGPHKYFDSNIPTLEKFNTKLGEVKNWTTDLTRLGVAGGSLPSGTTLAGAIDIAKGRAVTLLNAVFLQAIAETYGSTPGEQAAKGTEFYLKVQEGLGGVGGGAREELVAQMALNKANSIFNATKAAIGSVGALAVVNAEDIQPFIELQLMAEYLAALMPGEDFTKAIPDALITRLESAPFNLIARKTKTTKSTAVYAAKKLPWIAGHPRHVGAIVYFFRWYKKSVNPFDIATGRVTTTGIRDAMGTAIAEIGTSVQAHHVKRRLRTTDTADWTAVAREVALIRGV
ncbi:MAG TPA: hypothetical protein VGM67_06630 [Gemmatimonadaceae bacterium]|jgi:hypothetical protein